MILNKYRKKVAFRKGSDLLLFLLLFLGLIGVMGIIIFVVILLVLVLIHEFGHYIAAKKSGVRVEEFGFGLPPRVYGRKFGPAPKPGEEDNRTLYSLNLLPIGGFVRMTGEDATLSDSDPKNFQNAKLWKRMVIVLTGVFMNFILGIGLFAAVYSHIGIPAKPLAYDIYVSTVAANSPAALTGMREGDKIISVDGTRFASSSEVITYIKSHVGTDIAFQIIRDDKEITLSANPRKDPPPGEGSLGVSLGERLRTTFYEWYKMPFYGISQGFTDTVEMSKQIVPALKDLVGTLAVKQQVPEGAAGPVGIYRASRQFCDGSIWSCLQFTGLLSINLAIFNLLPLPALDGGRFLFMVIEAITRKKVNPKIEQWVHSIGLIFLILLLFVITYNDIFVSTLFKK